MSSYTIVFTASAGQTILPGEQALITLNRGDDFHLKNFYDLSGSAISSNKPVGVYSGHDCAFVPNGRTSWCNRLIEQLPPVNLWSKKYLTTPLRSRYGDTYRVLAAYDSTQVTINGVVDSVINRGEHFTVALVEASEVEANFPIMVLQHSNGLSYDANTRSLDPHYELRGEAKNKAAHWSTDQFIKIDTAPAPNYAFVLMPEAHIGNLMLDGVPFDAAAFGINIRWTTGTGAHPGPHRGAQIALSPGQHRFSAPVPFGLFKNTEGLYMYADPSMAVVPAVDNYLSAYSFQTPGGGYFARHFINITSPTAAISDIILDGQPIDPAHFSPLGASGYSYARLGVNIGNHYINSSQPFGLLVYGFGDADAYMYPGGWAFNQNQVSANLTITVDNAAPVINTQVCLAVSAFDGANAVIPFAQIALSISGSHADQRSLTANQSGVAQHCYEGVFNGVDQVSVQSGVAQQSTQIVWGLGVGNNRPSIISQPVVLTQEGTLYSYSVATFDADNDLLSYSLTDSPAGMVIDSNSGVISWNTLFGTYGVSVVVTDTAGATDQQSFQLVVNRAPVTNLLPMMQMVSEYKYVSRISASDPDGDNLFYALQQGNSEFTIDSQSGEISSFNPLAIGNYPITISISDRKGGVLHHSYTLVVSGVNSPPTLSASQTSFTISAGDVVNFNLTASDPNGDEVLVSQVSGQLPGLVINPNSGVSYWKSSNNEVGSRQLSVVATDEWGETSVPLVFDITVTENLPPQIVSVAPAVAYVDTLYEYQVIVEDPENRPFTVEIYYHPGFRAYIDNNNLVTFTPPPYTLDSTRIFRIRATDSAGQSVEQTVTFSVRKVNPSAPVLTGTLPTQAIVGYPLSFPLDVSDPDGDPVTVSLISGPSGMTVSSSGLIDWTPLADQVGLQEVVIRVSDGDKAVDYHWQIETLLNPLPLNANIVIDPQFIALGDSALLTVEVFGGINPQIDAVLLDGLPVTLSGNQATISATTVGRHAVVVNISDDGQLTSYNSFLSVTDPSDVSSPVVDIESPFSGSHVTSLTNIIGTVQDENLVDVQLYAQKTGSDDIIELYRGTNAFSSQVIADFDPTLLRNGQYHLVLQATDANNLTSTAAVTVVVSGGMKVGNFSVSFEELNIPVSGIPIRVTRSYDSRRKHESLDFGHGWSIDYQSVDVDESNEPTIGWTFSQESKVFTIDGSQTTFLASCMRSHNDKTVSVTLPNDDVEVFTVRLDGILSDVVADNDADCELVASTYFNLLFEPQEGTTSTLAAYTDTSLFFSNGNLVADIIDVIPVSVTKYRLTTKTGYVYDLDQDFGIETVTDPNGNSLTYSDSGIFHSDGASVLFERDANGRISTITDPMGQQISYSYSTSGDLDGATDRAGNTSMYQYDSSHYLTDLFDPLGRTVLKNIYDSNGRLIAQEDGDGNRTDFNHDIAGRLSIITDRLGRTSQFIYDDRGNVTSQVDALNNISSFTFDADDNQLSQTDALGNTRMASYNPSGDQLTQVDPLGNSVAFSYNTLGQERTIDDTRGNRFTNTYDGAGNLLTITDPLGNMAGQNINFKGYVTLRQDALENNITFTYNNNNGNLLTETDPLGNTVTRTYDANGNLLTETRSRMVAGIPVDEVTSFSYDNLDRLISTTDPLGNTIQTEYDVVGNESAAIDALGQRTEFFYDAYRRLIQTTYPDLTTATNSYDAEGNLLSTTDRLGRTSSYQYDALNRQIQTTFADGSFTQTEYDAVGRVTAEIDENGNRTSHSYDAAGRRIGTTDAGFNTTSVSYDADGNLISQTDANGNTVSYEYDSLDRRTRTTVADGSFMTEGYDALGRLTRKTDQAGKTTAYEYDALGRLTAVVDALLQRTEYTYDEAGNKLTQRDANSNTTSWTYDALGRVLTRTLPLGQTESFNYDANGNPTRHIDFNGSLDLFSYDVNNRLLQKQNAPVETYGYDAVGNRITITDSNGLTRYQYDSRDRLISETKPNGHLIEYQYDAAGNRTEVKTTVGAIVESTTYSYDALNRLSTVTDNALNVTHYTYDAVGNRASVRYPNGNETTYTYDSLNRLTHVTTRDSANTVIASFDYTLTSTGHRTQVIDLTGAATTYSYDDLYRLTNEALTSHPILGSASNSYTYDPVGNRIASTEAGVSTLYTYDNNDRLQTAGGESYTYDNHGNTLTTTIDATLVTNTYNKKNRLTRMVKAESGVAVDDVRYTYDIDGLRIAKDDDGQITNYLVDKNLAYGQVLKELDATNTTQVDYLYGDDLIKQTRAANDSYYLYDGHGSARALSDAAGSITDVYDYSAYGTLIDSFGSSENSYLYAGEQFDSNLDNYYLRARYYDQSVGRFTSMDTWMGDNRKPVTLHKYLYGDVDPVNNIDPSGNFSIGQAMAAVNVASTLASTAQTTIEVFSLATGDGEVSARQIGAGIILGMLPGASGLKLLKMSNLKKKVNGNSKKSGKPQHVYKIDDTLEFDIFKFGISGGALNKNGSSRRANTQANKLNRPLTFKRYVPKVLFRNVSGRIAALAIEKSLVCAYNKSKGRNPFGNKRPLCH